MSEEAAWHKPGVVMFDFDGTLTNAEEFFSEVMLKTAHDLGATKEQVETLEGYRPHESKEAFAHLTRTLFEKDEKTLKDAFLSAWQNTQPHFMETEALAVFNHLRNAGIPFAVVTNTPGEFVRNDFANAEFLRNTGFEKTPVYGLVSQEYWLDSTKDQNSVLHTKKPKMNGLIEAARDFIKGYHPTDTKWPSTSEVYYVGNRYESDAVASFNAGMIPVIIDPKACGNEASQVVWKMLEHEDGSTRVVDGKGKKGEKPGFPVIAIRSLETLTTPDFHEAVRKWDHAAHGQPNTARLRRTTQPENHSGIRR